MAPLRHPQTSIHPSHDAQQTTYYSLLLLLLLLLLLSLLARSSRITFSRSNIIQAPPLTFPSAAIFIPPHIHTSRTEEYHTHSRAAIPVTRIFHSGPKQTVSVLSPYPTALLLCCAVTGNRSSPIPPWKRPLRLLQGPRTRYPEEACQTRAPK